MTTTASLAMTEAEAMTALVGRHAVVVRGTRCGTETIMGRICTPLMIEDSPEGECITAVTIAGEIVETRIAGLPGAIAEGGKHVTLTLIPVHEIEFLTA